MASHCAFCAALFEGGEGGEGCEVDEEDIVLVMRCGMYLGEWGNI
jgi:hypothetical protein